MPADDPSGVVSDPDEVFAVRLAWAGGGFTYSTKVLYGGEIRLEVQPLTVLYATLTEKVPISYIFYRKKPSLSRICSWT